MGTMPSLPSPERVTLTQHVMRFFRACGGSGAGDRRVGLALGGIILAGAVLSLSPGQRKAPTIEASDALFARLVTEDSEAQKRWSWPEPQGFRDAWTDASQHARPIRLVRGALSFSGERDASANDNILSVAPMGDTFDLVVEAAADGDRRSKVFIYHASGWRLTEGSLDPTFFFSTLVFQREGEEVRVKPTYLSTRAPVDGSALLDWTYAAALLGFERPVYDGDISPAEREEAEVQKKEVLLQRAILAGDDALALSMYRRFRPAMRCSMDEYPTTAARSYADFCGRIGALGCFLQLQVQTLGQQSAGSASPAEVERLRTVTSRLHDSGLDVDRFLRGLALRYGGVKHRTEITDGSLARAALELGRGDAFAAAFTRIAEDRRLDDYNRLRATKLLAYLQGKPGSDNAAIAASLRRLSLTELSKAWLVELAAPWK